MPGKYGLGFWLAVTWLVLVAGCALLAPWLPVADPALPVVTDRLNPPLTDNVLGADGLGRDMLARVVHGAQVTAAISLSAVLIGTVIGGTLGLVVGYYRGFGERIVMAAVDVVLSFPALVLLLALVAYVGQGLVAIALVIGFVSIPTYTRVARANTLAVAQREFVLAARAMGARSPRILVREILPNVVPAVMAYGLVAMGFIIVVEGALAFLGLSVEPPQPTWGGMIAEGKRYLSTHVHVAAVPSVVMFLTVLSLNLAGDQLRGRLDVRESSL